MFLRLFWAALFTRGYTDKQCIKDLKKYGYRINSMNVPNNWIGVKMLERQLARMERCYYIYRTGNLKYNRIVDEDAGVSSGVLEFFRGQLKEITLNESVFPKIKKMAISILMAQQSNKTLYEIAHDDRAIGQMIDPKRKTSVAYYLIHNFPANADHDLINLAFYWANKSSSELTLAAINKTSSPKSLATLALFFRSNLTNMLQYVEHIIIRLGNVIKANEELLDEKGKSKYVKENCDIESNWLHPHEKSMLYSAHMALDKIITVFADENNNIYNNTASLAQEQKMVKAAIRTMTIHSFLQRISQTSNVPIKASWAEEHLASITHYEVDDEVRRDRLLAGICPDKEMLEAIEHLDFSAEENKNIGHIMADRLKKHRLGIEYTPKLSEAVAQAFCLHYYGSHNYQPERDTPHIATCLHCGKRIHSDPNLIAQMWWAMSQGSGFPGGAPDPHNPFIANPFAAPPGQGKNALPPADDNSDHVIDIEISPGN